MDLTLVLHSLSTLFVLWTIVILSFILGSPLASIFLEVKQKSSEQSYLFFYISIIIGYTVLNLSIFFVTLLFGCGTDKVAIPTLILILALSIAYMIYRKETFVNVITHDYLKKLFLVVLIPVASFHIILPILMGKWDMAYSTGDDASRWFMVVDYFRHNVFEYWKITNETLIWRLGERPLQNVSGAIICSIFNTNQAIGYSLSSASSSIMACFSFCLVVETMFTIKKMQSRYLLWTIVIAFFGFFGTLTNVFYTGRTTHHFSIYPVIACLGFVAVKNKFTNRLLWFLFWNVSLAYYYSIRFSLNYMMIVFVILGFQWMFMEINFKSLVKNLLAFILSFAIAIFAAWGEVKALLESITSEGVEFFLMQRGAGYGSDGTVYDRFMKWSGFISTYELAESIPKFIFYGKMVMVIIAILVAIYMSVKSIKKSPAYFALIAFNIAFAANLFISENYYVAWKSALYWPIYILIGLTAITIKYWESPKAVEKKIGIGLAIFIFLFIGLTIRQLDYFWLMTDQRYTKVDKTSYEMVKTISDNAYVRNKSKSQIKIFGFDYSSERHLLLREVFKDYDWQPVRDKNLNYIHDMVINKPELMDNYNYDFLLYANTYGNGEWIDVSGNNTSLLYDHYPFKIFSGKSSLIEFKSGTEIGYYRDPDSNILSYEGHLMADTCSMIFVNNGLHNWLTIAFRVAGNEQINLSKELLVTLHNGTKIIPFSNFLLDKKSKKYSITISVLNKIRISEIFFIKKNMKEEIFISKVKWGY